MKQKFNHSQRLRCIEATVTNADPDAVVLFELPKGTQILNWTVAVEDAFNTGATIDIGTSDDPDGQVNDQSIAAAGVATVAPLTMVPTTKPTRYVATVSDKTATGRVRLIATFTFVKDTVL